MASQFEEEPSPNLEEFDSDVSHSTNHIDESASWSNTTDQCGPGDTLSIIDSSISSHEMYPNCRPLSRLDPQQQQDSFTAPASNGSYNGMPATPSAFVEMYPGNLHETPYQGAHFAQEESNASEECGLSQSILDSNMHTGWVHSAVAARNPMGQPVGQYGTPQQGNYAQHEWTQAPIPPTAFCYPDSAQTPEQILSSIQNYSRTGQLVREEPWNVYGGDNQAPGNPVVRSPLDVHHAGTREGFNSQRHAQFDLIQLPRPSGLQEGSERSVTSSSSPDPIVCDVCQLAYSGEYRRGNLARHRKYKHTLQETILECEGLNSRGQKCCKPFKRQDAYLKHLRRVHPDEIDRIRNRPSRD